VLRGFVESSTVQDTAGQSFYVYVVEPSLFSKFLKHPTSSSGKKDIVPVHFFGYNFG
jgi:hypothetical protein